MSDTLAPYAKAVAGAISTILTPIVLALILAAVERAGGDVTLVDGPAVSAAVTAIVATFFVWLVRNREAPPD